MPEHGRGEAGDACCPGNGDVRYVVELHANGGSPSEARRTLPQVTHHLVDPRTLEAAIRDAQEALAEYDNALKWLLRPGAAQDGPLATEVWVRFELDARLDGGSPLA